MKGKKLSEIKKEYKFTANKIKQINNAKNWMLAKYGNVEASESVEVKSGKLRTIVALTSK